MPREKGTKLTEEHKRKISEARVGKLFSKEHIKHLSESHIGHQPTEDTRKKLSMAGMGRVSWNKGLHTSKETKEKMSLKNSGEKNGFYGKHHSEKALEKMRNNHVNKKAVYTEEERLERARFSQKIHKHRVKSMDGFHTLGEWELLKKQYNYKCPCCDRSEPEIKLTEDHIISVFRGGGNTIENIQPLCQSCNSKKHTKCIKFELKGGD
jgi:hypothetical protein